MKSIAGMRDWITRQAFDPQETRSRNTVVLDLHGIDTAER